MVDQQPPQAARDAIAGLLGRLRRLFGMSDGATVEDINRALDQVEGAAEALSAGNPEWEKMNRQLGIKPLSYLRFAGSDSS